MIKLATREIRLPPETRDLSAAQAERFKLMKAEAETLLVSVEDSAVGKDYPEGRVIQPQRNERWSEMEVYKQHFETFSKLKLGFRAKE